MTKKNIFWSIISLIAVTALFTTIDHLFNLHLESAVLVGIVTICFVVFNVIYYNSKRLK